MFNTSIFTLNKISHNSVEIIAEENVISYLVINENSSVTVKLPGTDSNDRGCITHETFETSADALDEVGRIWGLIGDAERSIIEALRSGTWSLPHSTSQEAAQ